MTPLEPSLPAGASGLLAATSIVVGRTPRMLDWAADTFALRRA